ncbi:MAG: phosphoribosylamine--glycine ligase [Desulfovibrio sp.]|jgi:phosphoribosylamine--glycine ligase|nr:phosphoribosylamine--glycine ligase [Desulfovibrio sp.]
MRILIIGSGGREHALAWKLGQSPEKPEIFIAPGNGGTALEGTNLPIAVLEAGPVLDIVREKKIDLVIPGPELPLVNGVADACRKTKTPCFGPLAAAARLEGSKVFAKEILREAQVPTANFAVFSDFAEAKKYLRALSAPPVIKADGLASGKGVVVSKDMDEALSALRSMLVDRDFGQAGGRVIIEEALKGEELSLLAFCAQGRIIPMPSAQDHKAAHDGDRGPNTGGMGAYSPAPLLPEKDLESLAERVLKPVLALMEKRGSPFSGILYAGLMLTDTGPRVLEFNVRFGDPECQPLLMRLESDLLPILLACAEGRLQDVPAPIWSPETALCVVMAARGYPGLYSKGMDVAGLKEAEALFPGKVKVFQAGTLCRDGQIKAEGGRILGVTALGAGLPEARERAYAALKEIRLPDSFYRSDIGNKGLSHIQS